MIQYYSSFRFHSDRILATETGYWGWYLNISRIMIDIIHVHFGLFFNKQTQRWKGPSVQFSCSVMSDSLWPHGLQHTRPPCHHQLLEFTQTHLHWVDEAIQPSHPLSSPSPLTLNLTQHQGLFQWVSSSYQVVKVLEFQLQHQSF